MLTMARAAPIERRCAQDEAAQRCTMPYRAPELFDLPSDAELDERTDIWVCVD